MTIKPISPDEVADQKLNDLPELVITTWNRLIARKSTGSNIIKITQDEIVAALMVALNCDRDTVFNSNYLDIEPIYRAVGWHVAYDKPGYNESYEAVFEFSKPKK